MKNTILIEVIEKYILQILHSQRWKVILGWMFRWVESNFVHYYNTRVNVVILHVRLRHSHLFIVQFVVSSMNKILTPSASLDVCNTCYLGSQIIYY